MKLFRFWIRNRTAPPHENPRLWLDLGDLGEMVRPRSYMQDHGLGLLRTILHQSGLPTDLASTRSARSWDELVPHLRGYEMLLMNVRSYTYPVARRAAELFKELNPTGTVVVGGLHATVALDEMRAVPHFDHICRGPGEGVIVDLVKSPESFPRVLEGRSAKSMAEWPMIDRELWPKPAYRRLFARNPWPLEPKKWGPPPLATILTSRVCPWRCAFCNENSYIPNMGRKPVEAVIDELNFLDRKYGPIRTVVIHDSMFFQNPTYLREWIDKYPRLARKPWPYWAAGRADTVRAWPELFERLVLETNWRWISIGLESGSDRVLRTLNKECTEEDNAFAIDLINQLGDRLEAQGKQPPRLWTNIMLGVPGETREDAFKTMRMLRSVKRCDPSIAFYAPYPGSALGYQLIAEGKSLMSKDNYHRFPDDEKLKGVDYDFYRALLAGRYDAEVAEGAGASWLADVRGTLSESLTKA